MGQRKNDSKLFVKRKAKRAKKPTSARTHSALLTPASVSKYEAIKIKRKRFGYSAAELARDLKMCLGEYLMMEAGSLVASEKYASINSLTSSESCIVLRTRLGLTRRELAARMNIAEYDILQAELGNGKMVMEIQNYLLRLKW